jgi:hypothetical protein
METDDPDLLDKWIANWQDIVDFEVFPVMTSQEATAKLSGRVSTEPSAVAPDAGNQRV